jgi:hypothetical protein
MMAFGQQQNGRRRVNRGDSTAPSFNVVLKAGRRSAPRMLAALEGVVHDGQSADGH